MAIEILVTGDYWHSDFTDLIGIGSATTTFVTSDKFLPDADSDLAASAPGWGDRDAPFDLIVIAQTRQGQFDQSMIDTVGAFAGSTPVIMLLGSWCEGEMRSDQPAEGVTRVFWHQWQGRFQSFVAQLANQGVTRWHGPATRTAVDRMMANQSPGFDYEERPLCFGVSAGDVETFDAISGAVESFGWKARWGECAGWSNLTNAISVICIDANSLDHVLQRRIAWFKQQFDAPLVVCLNFPRKREVEKLHRLGVAHVISKPWELNDLRFALEDLVSGIEGTSHFVPDPRCTTGAPRVAH